MRGVLHTLTWPPQLSEYPGLTRGLVAVLMYYDGRKSLVQSLRTLVQGRTGVSWTLELDPEVEDLVDTFTDQLLEEGIVEKILGELRNNNFRRWLGGFGFEDLRRGECGDASSELHCVFVCLHTVTAYFKLLDAFLTFETIAVPILLFLPSVREPTPLSTWEHSLSVPNLEISWPSK